MVTLPGQHPLALYIRRAKRYVKAHRSPLHELLQSYRLTPKNMEKILPIRRGVRYQPSFKIDIPANKDVAKRKALED
jgi:hypothetical protein